MIDTHAHLETLCDIDRGLDKIILAASNIKDSKNNLKLADKHRTMLLVSVGIHPQETNDSPVELENLLSKNYKNIVAIGECGLDFSGDYDEKQQRKIFEKQIELALKYKKPLIIHARKAVDEVIDVLKKYKGLFGVFHCYAGGIKRIKKVIELDEKSPSLKSFGRPSWYFGIDGNLTYEEGLIDVVKNIPKNRLILETDSPFLTPVPFRGEINSPKNVEYIYKKVAEIWQKSSKQTEKIIDENVKKLFSID